MILQEYFLPLEMQFDGGLHTTGDAFQESAQKLVSICADDRAIINVHLPINYLFRHSIELYLKSMIVTVHRSLGLPTADGTHTPEPQIKIGQKWIPLTRTHGVKVLLNDFDRLIAENAAAITERTITDWVSTPELHHWIDVIEAHDQGSTFSRYPQSGSAADGEKSSYVQYTPEELAKRMQDRPEGKPNRFVLALKNDDDEVIATYSERDEILSEFRKALVEASNLLSGCAFGLIAEFAYGYCRPAGAEQAEDDG